MGAEVYYYSVEFEEDDNAALQKLRQREFLAGRYNPVQYFPDFQALENDPPGAQHDTIEDALWAAEADGTRSILDLARVDDEPDFCVAARLKPKQLIDLFGTEKPTEEIVQEKFSDLLEIIERGHGICFPIYDGDKPIELIFVGYSFD